MPGRTLWRVSLAPGRRLSGDAAGFNNVELFVPLKPFEEWAPGMTKDKLIEQVQAEFSQQFTGIGFNLPGQNSCATDSGCSFSGQVPQKK
jgi:Cu/Ag efflux pump CusA